MLEFFDYLASEGIKFMSKKPYVVALACRKGGSGKSNTSTNLLVCARRDGVKAVIIDLDPQGSALDWGRTRAAIDRKPEEGPLVIASAPDQLSQTLEILADTGAQMVFLDTAGTIGPDIEAALAASHLVLIPVTPSVCDLKACLATARAARQLGKSFAFALNSCPTGQQRIHDAAALLSKLSVLAGEPVHRRIVYQDAFAQGLGVVEMDDPKAVLEITTLWQWLKDKHYLAQKSSDNG